MRSVCLIFGQQLVGSTNVDVMILEVKHEYHTNKKTVTAIAVMMMMMTIILSRKVLSANMI